MLIIAMLFIIFWCAPGIVCLYHADFRDDIDNGFMGVLTILGVTLIIMLIGPLIVHMVLDNKRNNS